MAASIRSIPAVFGLTAQDRLCSVAALHYAKAAEIFYPLLIGSHVHLLSEQETMFASQIVDALVATRATFWGASATALRLLGESGLEGRDLALRRVVFWGERMPLEPLRRIMAALPAARFANLYGTSEACAVAMYEVPRPLPAYEGSPPIGKPTHCHDVTLRDEDDAVVAPGETGEICVAGPVITAGYWKDPEMTAAKRVGGKTGTFRTGDLARLDGEGHLHLVGRKDHLVKLRGHRFNLGEIEAVLKTNPGVRDAVAVAVPTAHNELDVHVFVLAADGPGLLEALTLLCVKHLPSFARPTRIVSLDAFPLLATGKVDRRALAQRALAG